MQVDEFCGAVLKCRRILSKEGYVAHPRNLVSLGRLDILAGLKSNTVDLPLNGQPFSAQPESTRTTLLDLPREHGLTGATAAAPGVVHQ